MLWQRMANEEKEKEMKETIETTTSALQDVTESKERELSQQQRVHACSTAMTSLASVMEGARRRSLIQMINRWNCVAVSETKTARLAEEKDKEREEAVNAIETAKTTELNETKERHAEEVAKMTADHTEQVAKMTADHKEEVEKMTTEHTEKVEKMTAEHKEEVTHLETTMRQEKEAHETEVKQLKESHQHCMFFYSRL